MPVHAARGTCYVANPRVARSHDNFGIFHRRCRPIVRALKPAMGLDPQVKGFLEQQNETPVDYNTLTAEQARKTARNVLQYEIGVAFRRSLRLTVHAPLQPSTAGMHPLASCAVEQTMP